MSGSREGVARVVVASAPQDRTAARRLAAALRRYGAPRRFAASLLPLGRALDFDLTTEARAALREADHLVVVGGRAAGDDRWIDEAVRTFLALRRGSAAEGRLHLVATTPDAEAPSAALEAGAGPAVELGADRAAWRCGVDRVIAGLLGVAAAPFIEREASRRRRERAIAAGLSLALVGGAAGAAYLALA